ncbi:MAG: S24 family peptidase [Smithellaceae bacterium]|jgi:repressor LexA|nr:S24 family peptidase [Smithellaceae bacterium]MDD3258742.1 S24 family peptidase [Smithellaceae bacterium]MDD3848465.1 S24 family peptidase [Smithellaceae bacterium]HOG13185.1 S24 family peptidase [Smithellaceae bacterium]HOQ71264.1 S24 family peptidase [Smithellaceae bacterium]
MIEIFINRSSGRLQAAPIRITLKSHRSRHAAAFRQTLFFKIAGLPVSGEVCAGFPSPAEEELRGHISFDEYLVAHPESSFLLSVTGDSMAGAGIMDKDWVIIEKNRRPKNGDIILAEVDGAWTIKYYRKKGTRITLETAGAGDPPMVPREELRIAGVVTALVRKYHR